MSNDQRMRIMVLLAVMSAPATAVFGSETITAAEIAAAIRHAGMNVSAAQVELMSNAIAKSSAPMLKVQSIGPWVEDVSHVRLDCVVIGTCLPFVVAVSRSRDARGEAALLPSSQPPVRRSPVESAKSKAGLRLGQPAVLLLDSKHVHIRLDVICLENGLIGQVIRVAGKTGERSYLAEVCSDGTLRGTL
jgi:hypothetical protein